jgi:DNA repair exonuclease SbcCD ATPase subunit
VDDTVESSMEDKTSPPVSPENAAARSAAALRVLEERTRASLAASREQVSRLEADMIRQLDEVAGALQQVAAESSGAADLDLVRAELERANGELQQSRAAWLDERSALESQRDALQEKISQLEAQQRASQDEWRDQANGELQKSRAAWLDERLTLESQRDSLLEKISQLETQQRKSQDEWRNQLLDFEQRLREQQDSWTKQRADWTETRAAIERQRDELQQKFELALVDVQRLRGRVAELEQELARRPEANQADSAELVALRAERDALAQQVERLEQRPAEQIDPNAAEQFADLQRRFELAVEDVRELKTKNARLESQLAESGKRTSAPAEAGGMDWESQKRRLLAALEGGPEHGEPIPPKERATIEGTIEMTDAVVAEKDREITELKAQLEAGRNSSAPSDEDREQRINEMVDADQVIAEHRKRVAELEREMEEKLRAAELELSIERAKIARERVELDELQADIESQRQLYGPTGGPDGSGAPRRKWLSKLGLTGEE